MKIFALLVALFAVCDAKTFVTPPHALNVRGGGEIGPLDGNMAMKLSKTVATAYVAGAGSKYIASNTGGTNTQVSNMKEWFKTEF